MSGDTLGLALDGVPADVFGYPSEGWRSCEVSRSNLVATIFPALLLLVLLVPPNVHAAVAGVQENSSEPSSAGTAQQTLEAYRKDALQAQHLAELTPSEANLFLYASSLMR